MLILRRALDWVKRHTASKARVVKIQQKAREHARRTLECAMCTDPLALHERARAYCDRCWALRDENSDGVRPLGKGSQR